MNDLGLLLRSLPYLRPSQFPQRLRRLSAETALLSLGGLRVIGRPPARLSVPTEPERATSPRLVLWRLQPGAAERVAADAAKGSFEFLRIHREYRDRVDWADPSVPQLWRFQLNSFGWAWAIAAADAPGGGAVLARLAEEWQRTNPPRRDDAWHPFVASERLLNLLGTRSLWLPEVSDPGAAELWLWQHARLVQASLERDVGGNHLIREATALAVAGLAFGSPGLWDWALRVLTRATGRQILADGGHEERSPSYHLEVLTDLAELRALLPSGHPFTRPLDIHLGRMADFAISMCHPDRQVAMFNDCVQWPVPPADFLRTLGLDPHPSSCFPASGYYVLGEGENRLFFDAGPPSPRDLPPHVHCDLLSIELSVGGERMIVNSGTGDYARGEWRDYWRSTRAHNTVEVDRAEQSEVWHSFRMARRAAPRQVRLLRAPDGLAVSAGHNGYRRLRRPVIHRRLVARSGCAWVVVDALEGSGRHSIRSFLHLHPEVAPVSEGGSWLLRRGGSTLRVIPLGDMPIALCSARRDPIENWVADRLGERERGRALVLQGTGKAPMLFGWVLAAGTAPIEARIEGTPAGFRVLIEDDGRERVVDPSAWPRVPAGEP